MEMMAISPNSWKVASAMMAYSSLPWPTTRADRLPTRLRKTIQSRAITADTAV